MIIIDYYSVVVIWIIAVIINILNHLHPPAVFLNCYGGVHYNWCMT